jgi:hypothetical protein
MATVRVGQSRSVPLSTVLLRYFVFLYVCSAVKCVKDWDSNKLKGTGLTLKDLGNSESLTKLFASDGYFTDTTQEKVKPFNGISIQNEAQKLSANLRLVSNEEIGVTTMQVQYFLIWVVNTVYI